MKKLMIIFGTRPEAIKCVPVIKAIQQNPEISLCVCVTGQHREMLDRVMKVAAIEPQIDLDIMSQGQSLEQISIKILDRLPRVIDAFSPDAVLVQGDTTTAFAAALTAFYKKIPVAHIEAGLRSGNIYDPWPEEANRKLIGSLAEWHFAPTEKAKNSLLAENVASDKIHVTGNSGIDALYYFNERVQKDEMLKKEMAANFAFINKAKKLVLATTHRREHFDGGIEKICAAIKKISERPDVQVIFPVHPNPNVRAPVERVLGECDNVALIPPQDYLNFIYLMDNSYLILTDSGGVQEEAPSLGKPVLVMRDTTERPEGIEAGTAKMVGTDSEFIVKSATVLLDDKSAYQAMARAHNPYGDGKASGRIVEVLMRDLSCRNLKKSA